jgi:3-phosphoshikimate 1-carboxyvinyltransferase
MEESGVSVERAGRKSFRIKAGQRYQAHEMTIEGDCSSAAYFWAAAAVTGGYISTRNIKPFSVQPDFNFLDILSRMGCEIHLGWDGVSVQGGKLHGIDVDMNTMPDQVPTLAVIAALAEGKTIIRNVAHLKYKESDRLGDLAKEMRKLNIKVKANDQGMEIEGGQISAGQIDPHQDHRLAMSFAVARLIEPGIDITDRGCVSKSFPEFWELFEGMVS